MGLEAASFPVVAPSRSMTKLPTLSRAESMSCESGPSAFAGAGTASAGATALEERGMLTAEAEGFDWELRKVKEDVLYH